MTEPSVVGLFGQHVSAAGEPDPQIVAAVERLLDAAKNGGIVSLAYTACKPSGGTVSYFTFGEGSGVMVAGAVALLSHDIATELASYSTSTSIEDTQA